MSNLVLFTVIDIVLLIAGLAIYLWIVGWQLTRIATNLEECNDLVQKIGGNAASIEGNLEHVNRTGGVDRRRPPPALRDGGEDRGRRHLRPRNGAGARPGGTRIGSPPLSSA